jgi:hypothetical protein
VVRTGSLDELLLEYPADFRLFAGRLADEHPAAEIKNLSECVPLLSIRNFNSKTGK